MYLIQRWRGNAEDLDICGELHQVSLSDNENAGFIIFQRFIDTFGDFFVALFSFRTTYYHEAQNGHWYPVLLPLIVMAVPLYDFISVTALRISRGKSPFVGDTQHFSHRLKKRGLTDTQAVLTLYLATLATSLGATFLYQVNFAGAVLIFIQTVMVLSIIAVLETTVENDKTAD